MEICQRCGEEDEDLRTLWMACFYAMSELGLPFKEDQLNGTSADKLKDKEIKIGGMQTIHPLKVPVFKKAKKDSKATRNFFTLRVCKGCRADWMATIKSWFYYTPTKKVGCGSGIFIRENGALKEITEAEWYSRYPDREPVRVRRE